ncbi:MAG: DPP IV N-terminal domain-containing protein [Bacteroidales bacterium]
MKNFFLQFMGCVLLLMPMEGVAQVENSSKQNSASKLLNVDELMNNRSLYPKQISQIQWIRTEPACVFVVNNNLVKYNVKSKKTDTLITLQQIQKWAYKGQGLEEIKTFPRIVGVSDTHLLLSIQKSFVGYNFKTDKIKFYCSIPDLSQNFDFSKDYTSAAYTKDNNLYVMCDGVKFAVSKDTNQGIINGQIVHRNEFGIRKGTFWSAQGNKLAFYRMDETMVGQYPLMDYSLSPTAVKNIRYPEAGKKTHKVSLGIYDVNKFQTTFLEPSAESEDMYITGVTWSPNEEEIYTVQLNRAQKHLYVYCYDALSGKLKNKLFEEINNTYVEPEMSIVFRPGHPTEFIWLSERSGYNHIYLYNTRGELIKEITPAEQAWMVSSFIGFSSDGQMAYFMGTKDSPLEDNLYSVNIENGSIRRLTKEAGTHNIQMCFGGQYFIDRYSNANMAACTQIIKNDGTVCKVLLEDADPLSAYDMPDTKVFSIKAADDTTDLYARLILPPHFDSTKKYPVLIYVYGGPHAQMVTNRWLYGSGLFLQFMAQQGYIVFTLDNRGSEHRGFKFESAIHRNVGEVEVADQKRGIDYLKALPYVDTTRMGVDGWSYGGFMSLSLMLKNPGVFKVATAGGPVINWSWYEIMYGERYMGTPDDNPLGYKQSNLLNYVDQLQGKVMLIQGGLDNTVLPKHSISFVEKCINQGKQVDFFLYPQHEHNVVGSERAHLFRKLYEYYKANL